MRILHLHCDHVEYTPTKKEIPAAEETDLHTVRLEEVLVAFVAVEKGDDDTVASRAISQIKSVMERLGCSRLLLYPYAHLSADLAPARIALDVMEKMSEHAGDIESYRSAFGWTKSYAIQVKGHPLAEGLKIIRGGGEGEGEDKDESEAVRAESKIESHWHIMTPDGTMTPVSEFNFAGYEGLEVLAKYEAAKKRGEDRPPPHVGLMKRLAIADYEPASDQGNMRYYPNGRLIKSLIERYVTKQVREYGGFEVETPIMYDSDHPSMIKYFNRFPGPPVHHRLGGKAALPEVCGLLRAVPDGQRLPDVVQEPAIPPVRAYPVQLPAGAVRGAGGAAAPAGIHHARLPRVLRRHGAGRHRGGCAL